MVTNGTFFNYVFNYTDHIGNIRLSWAWDDQNEGLKIIEESHYYPFGLKHKSYNTDQYSFVSPANDIPGYAVPTLAQAGGRTPANPFKYKYNGKETKTSWDLMFIIMAQETMMRQLVDGLILMRYLKTFQIFLRMFTFLTTLFVILTQTEMHLKTD